MRTGINISWQVRIKIYGPLILFFGLLLASWGAAIAEGESNCRYVGAYLPKSATRRFRVGKKYVEKAFLSSSTESTVLDIYAHPLMVPKIYRPGTLLRFLL